MKPNKPSTTMTTTAKQKSPSPTNARGSNPSSPRYDSVEDIESIAKQISDHAEAIYQEWKARGLAPTEILKCHPDINTSLSKTFGLESSNEVASVLESELLSRNPSLSAKNLNQLVNTFVQNDKAKNNVAQKQQQQQHDPVKYSPSKKSPTEQQQPISSSYIDNSAFSQLSPPSQSNNNNSSSSRNNNNSNQSSPQVQHQIPDVLKDTIERCARRQKPETPAKPEHLLNHVPTWPLKNRVMVQNNNNNNSIGKELSSKPIQTQSSSNELSKKIKSADVLDEVSREEEKLINALKTGTALDESECLPEVVVKSSMDVTSSFANSIAKVENDIEMSHRMDEEKSRPAAAAVDEVVKKSINFTRVHTARIPSKLEAKVDDKTKFEFKTIPSPVRPFLSRGSVAERVLIFEKCPEKPTVRQPTEKPKISAKPVTKLLPPFHSTLQRHLRKSTNFTIPQFYFPNGKPPPAITTETTVQRLELVFNQFENYEIPRDKFHLVTTICQVPLYWRVPLWNATPLTKRGCVNGNRFLTFWRQMTGFCHDAASRFIHIISKGDKSRPFLLPEDMAPMIQDVVDSHPGLAFLKEAAEFHSRYVHTVIARIFFCVNRSWSGRITMGELRKSNLLEVIQLLEEEEDINQIIDYFSYEHFYVIYCKFWELDRDHDLFIDATDLARHNDHALSSRMIERIFSGCVTRSKSRSTLNAAKMSYTDFVWFILAEEDKNTQTAIEYWFRCMDLDGDGVLSMYELEYFYEEQQHRMEQLGIETLPFEDCLCQMLDMIKPVKRDCITLSDMKRCKMTPIFYDTFFNLEKYMEHEQKDPFAQKENDDMSDWDRFAAQEYELLVAEESSDRGPSDDSYVDNGGEYLESPIDGLL